jgi:hypothetical protein
MTRVKFFLKLIFGTLAIVVIFNFYILPIVKNYSVYLSMSGIQESAETMIKRGYTRTYCDPIKYKYPKDKDIGSCLKNAELMSVSYYPAEEEYAVEAFYHGEYKDNVACELHISHNKADPYDPYTCSFVSYNKIKNQNVPYREAYLYFRANNTDKKLYEEKQKIESNILQ